MNIDSGPQLDLAGAVKRRWHIAAWTTGLVFLAVWWISFALPNEYESYATLLVEPQAVSDNLVQTGAEDVDINNRLHLMTAQILARSRLSRIIDDLELYEDESDYMLREEVIDLMRSKIAFVPVLPALQAGVTRRDKEVEITTFQLWFKAHMPATASKVAQRLADDFIKEHISERVQQTQKSLEFIEAQLQRLSNRMQTVEQQIARVKDENPGRLPEVLFSNHRLLERAVQDERTIQQTLTDARSDAAYWASQALLSGKEPEVKNDESSGSRQLRMLELRLAELKGKGFTDRHPDVQKVRSEYEEVSITVEQRRVEAELEAQAIAGVEEEGLGDDPMIEEVIPEDEPALVETLEQAQALAEKRRAEARIQSALAEIERLQENQYIVQNRIDATPRVAEQLESLEREYAQLHVSLNDFSHRRTEAMVQANLERRQLGEKFRILEAAFPPIDVSWPNRRVMIPMGLIVGLALGFAAAVVSEAIDHSFYSSRELQSTLSIPVLATIPRIWADEDRRDQRRRVRRSLLFAIVAAVITMVGSGASYWYMNGLPGFLSPTEEEEALEGGEDQAFRRAPFSFVASAAIESERIVDPDEAVRARPVAKSPLSES